jgi:beta-fructofuranosidase
VLRLPDHWVWDSWLAVAGDRYHLFFLRASRALLDPDRRHLRASIGHAVSTDLRSWRLLPDALVRADPPAWDRQAVWTGSVVRGPDGRWYLFYTGVERLGPAPLQRIGLALSEDLVSWRRVGPDPVLEADPRWYECLDGRAGVSEAWRDPYVFADPDGDGWHMLITARVPTGDPRWRGVIGHARSQDLLRWTAGPPLTAPDGFGELEVAQVQFVAGRAVLIFSCPPAGVALRHRSGSAPAAGPGATWTVPGGAVRDGWDLARAVAFPHPSLYTGRLIQDRDGGWCLLGFRHTEDGVFHGEILDPIPVEWAGDRLVSRSGSADVAAAAPGPAVGVRGAC